MTDKPIKCSKLNQCTEKSLNIPDELNGLDDEKLQIYYSLLEYTTDQFKLKMIKIKKILDKRKKHMDKN